MKKETIDSRKDKVIVSNRKARHLYFIKERFEAGIELRGTEVKSLRAGRASLSDSYATVDNREVFLHNSHIQVYEQANRFNHNPIRLRRLLLHKSEIKRLLGKIKEKGMSLVPLSMYFHKNKVKVELALVKGKKSFDKRHDIESRDAKRDMERTLKEMHRYK
ncbi:MAG: SsrA-binding protein [Candidatus Cloacimonetes bacterium 4572_55]|nr:MAG: SsrA-binding protein [Candidatus Cloacimonetes bacterium 4572_55]